MPLHFPCQSDEDCEVHMPCDLPLVSKCISHICDCKDPELDFLNDFRGCSLAANLMLRLEIAESPVSFDSDAGLGSDPNWGCLCRL
ncbi:hypothetical protein P8452_24715 [Trifolium repens]|nr:hypothetical protein P8452_24715 [Trifolium repens]